jgi:hypothetical protein
MANFTASSGHPGQMPKESIPTLNQTEGGGKASRWTHFGSGIFFDAQSPETKI